jgi:2-dehydropantoate 2-reductase
VTRILVVGPGAIGGVLACRWAESGHETALLGRTAAGDRALTRLGIEFTGTSGTTRLIAKGLVSARKQGPRPQADAVFFCVKSHQTERAAAAAKRWVGPATAVVGLQNGVGHEKILRRAFGSERVVIGICYIAADRTGPRTIIHNGGKDIHLARTALNGPAAQSAAGLLRLGGWDIAVDGDEDAMLWTKLCFNAAGNPLGALCGATNGDLGREPALRELMTRALLEAVEAASADGHRVPASEMEAMLLKPYPNDSRQRNSMLQDLQAGRRTEIDAIVGPIIGAAKRRGVTVTLLPTLARFVKKLESAL